MGGIERASNPRRNRNTLLALPPRATSRPTTNASSGKWETVDAALDLPANADLHGGAVTVEMTGADPEITLRNNRVEL
jgi:hypothetical protein